MNEFLFCYNLGMILEHVNLTNKNTLHTPAQTRWFISVGPEGFSSEELEIIRNHPRLCLGSGSNTCFVGDFEGVIISSSDTSIQVNDNLVTAGAGLDWDAFVADTLDRELFGLENLSLIPGTVGAAPVQNIGAYGVEVSEMIHLVHGINLLTGKSETLSPLECQFSYRNSIFKTKLRNIFLITQVTFTLSSEPNVNTNYTALNQELTLQKIKNPTPQQIRDTVIAVRQSKLPDWKTVPNAGSFFKNPIISDEQLQGLLLMHPSMPHWDNPDSSTKIPAAWLLETAGWKGRWIGNVGCYEKQPLVLVTNGQATGNEIVNFAHDIINSIKEGFGIILEPEVNIINHATKIT